MDTPITLVTGNAHKLRELMAIAPDGLDFTSQKLDLDEIQSLDLHEVVEDKVRRAYDALGTPVIVEDVSAGLKSLNGLPGPFIKFFEQQLGRGALYTLSKDPTDRLTIHCIAAYFDGEKLLFGEGTMEGDLVAPRGENGFGFDCVIEPDDQPSDKRRTVAEMSDDEKNTISHRSQAMRDLLVQL
jgi:non-canonical purine NTP pyrophosphatase (RdgB/HAM1 family)